VAAVLAVIAASHVPGLAGPFIWDDRSLILENPATRELQPLGQYFVSTFWQPTPDRPTFAGYYRPLVALSYAVQYRLHGEWPVPFHLFNLGVHLTVALLLLLLARRLGAGQPAALLATTTWGLLPRLTECVDWVSGRTDLLAGAFTLGALLAWDGARVGRRWLAAGLLGLGLLSKEVALATLPAVAVWELWSLRRSPGPVRAVAWRLAPLALVTLAWLALRAVALRGAPAALDPGLTAGERALRALDALGRYGWMLAQPFRPSALLAVAGRTEPWAVAVGALLAVAALALAVLARRRFSPPVALALALGGASLLPVLHLVDIHLMVSVADRFLYLPLAGLALALALGAGQLSRRTGERVGLALAALALAFGVATYARSEDYADEARFWLSEVGRAPPELAIPRAQLGGILFREGRFAAAARLFNRGLTDMRAMQFHQADVISMLEVNIALCLAQVERVDAALEILDHLIADHPEVASHRFDRARVLLTRQDWEGGRRDLAEALALFPGYQAALAADRLAAAAARAWSALPPAGGPGETTAQRATRARILSRVEARAAAGRLWVQVLEAPDAAPEERRAAAAWLVRFGPAERARQAAQVYAASGADDGPRLTELLELRLARLAELDALQARLGL
jgi:tetratricopeptide (TPR) repeat protein